ncbi:MAG TPA: plastocyanin/azurin family copper-binding protein [Nitrosopumilaceae archaeon]|nr:plastocyanin/azurin family copper-binding protein [Nitrosopumilaceae archaeon]
MIKAGNTFQYKFSSAGTTEYFCTIHPWMTGKVTVG